MTITPTRRFFLQSSAALAGTAAMGGNAQAAALPFRYAYSATSWDTNVEEAVRVGERLGFIGIEPFRNNVINFLDKPLVLKKFMDDHHIQMATCSNAPRSNSSMNGSPATCCEKRVHRAHSTQRSRSSRICEEIASGLG